jgi:hypothetical protein
MTGGSSNGEYILLGMVTDTPAGPRWELSGDLAAASDETGIFEGFEARASDDPVKTDLELTHAACGTVLCDIELGDSMSVLAGMMTEHTCPDVNLGEYDYLPPRDHDMAAFGRVIEDESTLTREEPAP